MSEDVKIFTDDNFEQEVLNSSQLVVVDFFADWCGPCKAMAPVINYLATTYKERVKVGKLNIEENITTSARYGIRSVPTLFIFKEGKVQEMMVGLQSREKMIDTVEKYL